MSLTCDGVPEAIVTIVTDAGECLSSEAMQEFYFLLLLLFFFFKWTLCFANG